MESLSRDLAPPRTGRWAGLRRLLLPLTGRQAPKPGPGVVGLVDYLFAGIGHDALAAELGRWLAGSGRFRAFVDAYRDKIRRKLRGASDQEARSDVRAELAVARLLLGDRRVELAFEAYGSGKAGPDFTVTFSGATPFNLEVTRLRGSPVAPAHGGPLLTKLHQLPPSKANVLLLAIEGADAAAFDVGGTVRLIRNRADRKDEAFFVDRDFDGTRGFYDRFLRLGAVLVWCDAGTGERRAAAWVNRSARIAVPERAVRACLTALRAPGSG